MSLLTLCLAVIGLSGWLYLAFAHGHFWLPALFAPVWLSEAGPWPGVDIVVPARDEAAMLPQTLPGLLAQDYPGAWRVILVDDHSTDTTATVAGGLAGSQPERLRVIAAPALPAGWRGKVAAMQAGVAASSADYILFTDADIRHPPDSLRKLVATAAARQLDLTSLMVRLHCTSMAEKLLIPAFVFFFAMLFPFRRAGDPRSPVAAAAGGAMLVRRAALDRAGGLARIKAALIDDCALARLIKSDGGADSANGRIDLSLATEVESLRPYPQIGDVRDMIARTAFTQLNYSPALLAGCVLGLTALFIAPPLLLVFAGGTAATCGALAFLAMTLLYLPMIVFYRQNPWQALTLPLAALLYIAATVESARRYGQGRGGQWKGRAQA